MNLAAAFVFWLLLAASGRATMAVRYFLFIACTFDRLAGTGYFLFSGVTDFGIGQS